MLGVILNGKAEEDTMTKSNERIALVAGASRGVGKGIALGLGEAGYTVYVSGRTLNDDAAASVPGTLEQTVEEIEELGGIGVAVCCDHVNDVETAELFRHIETESGRLDMLVNSVWGGYDFIFDPTEGYIWERPFWKQSVASWDGMFKAGVRAAYVASVEAARLMTRSKSGVIVNLSHPSALMPSVNVGYGVSKAATDKLTEECARQLQAFDVAAVAIYPGIVRTERVMAAAQALDLTMSHSPLFVGRVVAALADDDGIMSKSGRAHHITALASEYAITENGTC